MFVGGLPELIREDIIQEVFDTCGYICSIRLSKKSFAHIRFQGEECVERALYFSGELMFLLITYFSGELMYFCLLCISN